MSPLVFEASGPKSSDDLQTAKLSPGKVSLSRQRIFCELTVRLKMEMRDSIPEELFRTVSGAAPEVR